MQVYYLEIVTEDVEATCATYREIYGVEFGKSVPELGSARTAELANGGKLGIRAPMSDSEEPVVRPYLLVPNIQAAVTAAVSMGAEVAHPPMPISGQGMFAIYLLGGVQHGLWEL